MDLNRRGFCKIVAASAAVLSIGVSRQTPVKAEDGGFDPSFFLDFLPNGHVRVKITRSELGQGVQTGLAQIVAGELGARWEDVEPVIWPYEGDTDHIRGDYDGAGGSQTIRMLWMPLRIAAAGLREMLCRTAALQWMVSEEDCAVSEGEVLHKKSGRRLSFSDLFDDVRALDVPSNPTLKASPIGKVLGKPLPSVGNKEIITGERLFSIDVKVPGMVHGVIARPPCGWG